MSEETAPNLGPEAPTLPPQSQQRRKRRSREELIAAGISPRESSIGGTASSKPRRDKELDLVRDSLGGIFTLVSMGIGFIPHESATLDSVIFLEKSPPVIEALIELARRDERVRKILVRLSETSAYGQLATALLMLALPIAANHGLVPSATLYVAGLSDETLMAIQKYRYEVEQRNAANDNASVG